MPIGSIDAPPVLSGSIPSILRGGHVLPAALRETSLPPRLTNQYVTIW